ncbi:hypothetical protein [Streptosporangium saharense]|uniref:GerMN domain-containing protein n=1 Tax=Streptosporangium saharense TaxID=1706840 RepID=A0A7W7QV73_9ACTN|nr:hypothetical protein [Streptosporangium saharense]MBB4920285.1 hypothetical protein [Streptosporangium saharense]
MRALAVCAALLALCTACGVGPSDVIRAGEPARGFLQGTPLYFVRHGRLVAVSRPEGPLAASEAVELLVAGPTTKERERSFDTRLPKDLAVQATGDGFALARSTPLPASRLTRLATGQLVCTIAAATATERGVDVDDVRVTVPDGNQSRCADFMALM